MECPKCHILYDETVTFCPKCKMNLKEIINENLRKEVKSELEELGTLDLVKNLIIHPNEMMDTSIKMTEGEKKEEYKKFLKEIFSKGMVSADEIDHIRNKIKILGLESVEALKLQKEVAKELGIQIQEEIDLKSLGDVVVEINTNKYYVAGQMNNLELQIRNGCKEYLDNVLVSAKLAHLPLPVEKLIHRLKPNQEEVVHLPFLHPHYGTETVEIFLQYYDSKRNPSIYRTEIEVLVGKEEKGEEQKSVVISFNAEKIMGNDFSNMATLLFGEKREPKQIRKSFYAESEKQWVRLPITFDEEETNKKRNEIIINKRMKEGEVLLKEGESLKEEGIKFLSRDKAKAREMFDQANNLLTEAKGCFQKILEINEDHAKAFENIKKIEGIRSEIEGKIGPLVRQQVVLGTKIYAGKIILQDSAKDIFLISKNRITIGRDRNSDILLRLFPYQWKPEYDEEVRRIMKENIKLEKIPEEYFPCEENRKNLVNSFMISRKHAEIIEKTGLFFIKDVGSHNGTFIEGKKLQAQEEHMLKDNIIINIAGVLDLECNFLGESKRAKERGSYDSCFTVLGEKSDSCFGIDKKGWLDAIKLRRLNNYLEGEEYIILIRAITIGSSRTNAIVIEGERVSDIHAKIFYRNGGYWIEDLNSRYGTRVNGEEIRSGAEIPLGLEAEILIGDTKMFFRGRS